MLTIKRSGDSAHPCRRPIPTVNGRDLTLPTRRQTSEQEYIDLAASNRRPSTQCSRNTPESFSHGTRSFAFSRSTKHVKMSLAYSEYFSKFCWGVKCSLYCCGRAEYRSRLNYFATSFFKELVNVNVDYLKIPIKHLEPHKTPSPAACLRPLA